MVPADARAEVVLLRDGEEVACWPLRAPDGRVDLAAVDAVARLELEARRQGCTVWLRHACPDLVDLLELTGLAGVLQVGRPAREAGLDGPPQLQVRRPAREVGLDGPPQLQVRRPAREAGLDGPQLQVGRKAECLEQAGVEEVVVPDDPVA